MPVSCAELAARMNRLAAVAGSKIPAPELAARMCSLAARMCSLAARLCSLVAGRNRSTAPELTPRGEGLVLMGHNTVSIDESLNSDMQLTPCKFQITSDRTMASPTWALLNFSSPPLRI